MNLSYNPFADGSVIKFGKGFEDLQLSVSGPEFTVVPPTEIAEKKPVLEFTLGCGSQTAPVAPKPSVFSRIEQPGQDQKLKSVVIADSSVPFSAPSQFEIGSSSSLPEIMTKTQRRNRNRRMKKRMEKLEKKEHITPTSPHLSGSRFNPLSTAEGEEDARVIARSTPATDRKTAVKTSEEKEVHIGNMVRAIVRECADSHSQSREGFLRNMKRMISEKIEEETSKQKSVGTRVVSQSRSRNNKRTFKPVAVSALTDGYPREPRRSHRKTDSIVLTDSSAKPRSTQYVPRKVSRQLSPSATPPRESRKAQRYSQTHSSPRIDRHHPTVSTTPSHHEVERLEAPNQPPPTSGEKEVWEPKEKATSPIVASPKMPIGEERKEEGKVEISTADPMDCERYVPVDPHYISGRSIEEMLGELKESIKNLDDKEALDLEVDQDDMLDDEIADVMMVDTRRSSQEEQVEGVGIQDVVGPLPPRAQAESSQPESVQVVGKKQVVEVMEEHQQDLETKASQAKEIKQMEEASQLSFLVEQSSLDSKKLKPQKIFEKKSGTVSAVEKGKQPMKVQVENPPPQFYNQQYQRPQFQPQFQPPFQPQHPPPQYPPPQRPPLWIQPQFNQQRPYLTPDEKRENWEKFNTLIGKTYPFKREALKRIFKNLLKKPDFKLPAPRRPEEVGKSDQPNYCLYHQMLGHQLEDCVTFKEWLDRNMKLGAVVIPKEYLVDPGQGSAKCVTGEHIVPTSLSDVDSTWDIVLSRSSKKLLNKLYSSSLQESSGAQKPLQVDLIVPEDSVEMTPPSELKEARVSQAPIVQKKEDTSDCFVSSSSVVRDVSSSKVVFSADGEAMILNPLTLDDFCFVLRDDMKSMEKDSVYILSISDSDVTDDLENTSKNDSLNDQFNFEELKHSLGYHSDSDVLALDLQGTPICIEAEMSDSENVTELKPELAKKNEKEKEEKKDEEYPCLENSVRWHPVPPSQRGGRMTQWGRGRGRGSQNYESAIYENIQKQTPTIHIDLESDSEDESYVLKGENINKRPKFEIPLEHDSDEDKIQANIEGDSKLSTYEKLKGYAKTLALTPLSQDSLAGLAVKVSPALSDDCKTAKFIPSTSKNIETDVNIDDPFMNEIVELPFDWYPYGVKNLIEQGLTPSTWTKRQAKSFENLWDTRYHKPKSKAGLGFSTVCPFDDDDYCLGGIIEFVYVSKVEKCKSGKVKCVLENGEVYVEDVNCVCKEMGTDVKEEKCEWQAHELEPNPRPLKRRFVFWYTRRTKVHPPPPLPALEATLGVPPPKPQDVLFFSKVHGPVKRRKVSAIRQFPPGCGPGSGAATSV
ncbi:hypothetical protein M5K25_026016 [Dendrobium thyrsiflorum]|uniref:Uncharacterized protein n=1 Tax=Dendrobium thyrsiflorum TaxID=117978 RepID=A0ABD0TWC3_DENTH